MPDPSVDKHIQNIMAYVESPMAQKMLISEYLFKLHKETKLSIHLPTDAIRKQSRFSYDLIQGRAKLDSGLGWSKSCVEVDCFVAYGAWNRLGQIKGNSFDLVEHIEMLLPQKSYHPRIGLFTCQNGIQNDLEDFETMCSSIKSQLTPEHPLFIGFHNPTSGKGLPITEDLKRLWKEPCLNAYSFLTMRQMMATFVELLDQICPKLLWAHIAHSEGGLIARTCLKDFYVGLSPGQKKLAKQHLITLVYGGVTPIPDECAYDQINTYSSQDIALKFVKKYLDKFPGPDKIPAIGFPEHELETSCDFQKAFGFIPSYPYINKKKGHTITVVKSIVKDPPLVEGDHAFIGDTYQEALKENIKALRRDIKIYDSKKEF